MATIIDFNVPFKRTARKPALRHELRKAVDFVRRFGALPVNREVDRMVGQMMASLPALPSRKLRRK